MKEETQGLYLQLKIKMNLRYSWAASSLKYQLRYLKENVFASQAHIQCFSWQLLLLSETHTLCWLNFQLVPKLTYLTPDQGSWALCSVAIKILWRGIMIVRTSKGAKNFKERKVLLKCFTDIRKNSLD